MQDKKCTLTCHLTNTFEPKAMPYACLSYSKVKEKQEKKDLDIRHQRRHLSSWDMVKGVCNPNTWEVGAAGQ